LIFRLERGYCAHVGAGSSIVRTAARRLFVVLAVLAVSVLYLVALGVTAPTAFAAPTGLDAQPNRVNFGRVAIGNEYGIVFGITNNTGSNLSSGTWSIGANEPAFTISANGQCTGACSPPTCDAGARNGNFHTGTTIPLAAGATCSFEAVFQPTEVRRYVDALAANWNGGSVAISVTVAGHGAVFH
jgi:hypothetical protein